MELTLACPKCGAVARVAAIETAGRLVCPSCGVDRPVTPGAVSGAELTSCAACGTSDLYIQKDFPQGLGLAIVVAGFAISSVFWYYRMPLWTYAILLASALLDMVLYYRVPDVTICYRCLAQHRGPGSSPPGRYRQFDLAVGERYRQERLRVEEHRSRRRDFESPSDPSSPPDHPTPGLSPVPRPANPSDDGRTAVANPRRPE